MNAKLILLSMSLVVAGSLSAGAIDGAKLFEGKCAKCHGADGDGKGKAGKSLDPRPTDFTSAKWQSDIKDVDVVEAITYGSKSTKLKISRKMPEFGTKLKKEQVLALVTVIRSFKKSDAK